MRIGLAIYHFNPKKGGAERYAYDLSTHLVKKGHEVSVFCAHGIETEGIRLLKINTTNFPRWLRNLSFAINQKRCLKSAPVDIMLGFGNVLSLDVYQSHGGVHNIWMEREIESCDNPKEKRIKALLLKSSFNQRVQKWIAEYPIRKRAYKRIVAISDMLKTHMAQHYKLKEDDFDVVYNGVDIKRFTPPAAQPSGDLKILFSAGNFRLKGLGPLIEAIGDISKKRRDFRLVVMGRGKRRRYSELIRRHNVTDLVVFLGEQTSPEKVYRESHMLVHPTFYDACSLTTMESMASGLPTITTKWNGASALLSEGEGFVIDDPRNVVELSGAISRLFDENLRISMGKAARQKIEQFTMEKNAAEMENVLLSTL